MIFEQCCSNIVSTIISGGGGGVISTINIHYSNLYYIIFNDLEISIDY